MANFLAILGIVISIFSAYYAYQAYCSSKEITYPKRRARRNGLLVENFSKEAKDFHAFLADNIDRKVYINVLFGQEVEVSTPTDENYQEPFYVVLWDSRFDSIPPGDKPSNMNCTGVEIHIDQDKDTIGKFGYERGYHRLQGQFYIYSYAGPYQGVMSAILLPIKLS